MYELFIILSILLNPIESCIQSNVTFLKTDVLRPSYLHEGRRYQRTDPAQSLLQIRINLISGIVVLGTSKLPGSEDAVIIS